MERLLLHSLFGKEPAAFHTLLPPEEAAKRLSENVEHFMYHTFYSKRLTGRVSIDKVRVYKQLPILFGYFTPIYTGRFVARDGGTFLEGGYSIHGLVKVFVLVWILFLLTWGAFTVDEILSLRGSLDRLNYAFLGMPVALLITVIYIWINLQASRHDIDYISAYIRRCIEGRSVEPE